MFPFENQIALVTGGASGIGLGIARSLGKRGVRVVICDIDKDALDAVAADFPGEIMPVVLDVRDRNGWNAVREKVESEWGYVSILVNNAGVTDNPCVPMSKRGLVDYEPERWDRMIGINLTGVANGIMTFGKGMRDRKFGHIVNTSSTQGLIPTAGVLAYSAAKNGVTALSEALRDELAPSHVGVTVLFPGVVSTNLAYNEAKRMGMDVQKFKMPGMEPDEVGELTVKAIYNNTAFVMTHGEYAKYFTDRALRIQAAFTEARISNLYDPMKPPMGTREWALETLEKETAQAAAAQ